MKLVDYLFPDRVIAALSVNDKRQFLDQVSRFAAQTLSIPAYQIEEALTQRERLCSTAFGKGVAVPHANIKVLRQSALFFVKTAQAIDFESLDGEDVDLFFVILTPENAGSEHLRLLAYSSRLLRDPHIRTQLRGGKNEESLYAILTGHEFHKKVS